MESGWAGGLGQGCGGAVGGGTVGGGFGLGQGSRQSGRVDVELQACHIVALFIVDGLVGFRRIHYHRHTGLDIFHQFEYRLVRQTHTAVRGSCP